MAAPVSVDANAPVRPRWGMGDAAAGWFLGVFAATVATSLIAQAAGYTSQDLADGKLPLWAIALSYPPLWLGFAGVPIWAAARKGNGFVTDFRVRFAWIDVPVGIVAGVVGQLLIVPLVSQPFLLLFGKDASDLSKPAQDLADKAQSTPGLLLFALIVVVGAPIAEELFFRGLLLRSIEKRFSIVWAIVGSSVIFGLTHFEPLQTPGLIAAGAVFALVSVRADRLGPSIIAHMAFNGTAVVALVLAR